MLQTFDKKLGIVTPLANEVGIVDELIGRTLSHIPENTKIFYVLDNVSKDGTIEKIKAWEKKDPRIKLIWAPENRSAIDAYFRGYLEAYNAGCDWILEMDGGLSHQPEQIPRFIEAMKQGREFAGGSRFMRGGRYATLGMRYVISRGGTLLTNLLVGTKMKDMTSGFECFNRKTMKRVLEEKTMSHKHFFQTEIRTMMHDYDWVEIPITYKDPSASVGGASIKDAFKNLWRLRKKTSLRKK